MKYRIFALLLVLCLLSGCKIELPSQHSSTVNASSAGISVAGESSSLPGLASDGNQPSAGGSSSGQTSAAFAGNPSFGKSSLSSSSKASSPKPASSDQAPSAASRAPSSVSAGAASAPAKQTVLTFSIICSDILAKKGRFDAALLNVVPAGGTILPEQQVAYTPGESVLDVLQRVAQEKGIILNVDSNKVLGTAYVTSIAGIGEKNFGPSSGWTYRVTGKQPAVGSSGYRLKEGQSYQIEWFYVCGD